MKRLMSSFFTALLVAFAVGAAQAQSYVVDFENETSGGYASETVNLSGLDWDLAEALIGTATADWKNGAKSARLRGYGTSALTMLEDKTGGIGIISFQYRRYGTDTQVAWRVEISTDGGTGWTQVGADFTAPASDDVQTFSEIVEVTGNARIRIVQDGTAGTSNRRLNVDDIVLTDYAGGGPIVPGCTDVLACNYDAAATLDDGSCLIIGNACDDGDSATTGDVVTAACNCEGTAVVLPVLRITEIHYNPNDGAGFPDNAWEFVEIYNADVSAVDLEGYTFFGVTYTFPLGATIAPGEYVVVAVDPTSYSGAYQTFGPFTGALGNGGETVSLIDNLGNTISSVNYGNSGAWPALSNGTGLTLELADVNADEADPANWQASCSVNGTPGAANSTQPCASLATTIAAIQADVDANGASNQAGQFVTVTGIVTGVYSGLFSLQDGLGAWSGIWVEGTGVVQGDDLTVTGWLTESNGLTTIVASEIAINSNGNALPAFEVLTTAAISDEQWEGVLLRTTGVIVNGDLGFGEFSFDDGSGIALADDLGYLASPLSNGDSYRVSGPNFFSFGNFKLQPRDLNDVEKLGCTDNTFPNFDPEAVVDDGSCSLAGGCTDPEADNYDENAGVDDGSCIFSGCTDPAALNFDPQANNDDGSCFFTLPNIVINEIHYNPCVAQGDDTQFEFVELYNAEATAVDLSAYTFSAGITFTFDAGASIAAGEYLIVAIVPANYEGNGYQVFGPFGGALGNSGELVELADSFGNVIDAVTYGDGAPWPASPDGTCPTLELIDPALDNADAANWQGSLVDFGTPGAANTQPDPSVNFTISEIQSDVDAEGGSNLAGTNVTTNGIVTAVYPASNLFTIQDGTGPWSGIWVEGSGVNLGDEVDVTGIVTESFGLTLLSNVSAIDVLTSGNLLPANQALATAAINDEQWEGVMIEMTAPVSVSDAGFGEWALNDGSGTALVDDLGVLVAPADLGVTYTVIGPNYFSFGSFKLQPRDLNDALRWGCTDNTFPNFDPLAVIDDGSCAAISGCTNPIADNYNPAATVDDGSCIINGCTDETALNYNPEATNDDGSCYFTLPNLVINEIHYNPCNLQGDDFDYEFFELFNAEASAVDLSGYVVSGSVSFTFPQGASIAAGEYIVVAVNATSYEGNGYQVFQWESGNMGNTTGNVTLSDAFGNVIDAVGYTDVAPWPVLADGQCLSAELIDPSLDNADGNSWQGSFVLFGTPGAQNSQDIQGCTNQAACNYNAAAIADDGSCEFDSCAGCTYESAINYDAAATVDDGSCTFTNPCPGDINSDAIVNTADLLLFLTAFGTSCN